MAVAAKSTMMRHEVSSTASVGASIPRTSTAPKLALDVEIDGAPHITVEGKRKDETRDAWMRSQEIEVLRFGGWQVESDTQQVLQCIDEMLSRRSAK